MSQHKRVVLLVSFLLFQACSGNRSAPPDQFGINLLSTELKKELQHVSESIVSVQTVVKLVVQKFEYATRDGRFVPDENSPVKYRLQSRNGHAGVDVSEDERTLSGGGVIIYENFERHEYSLLTSSHLVAPQDTTDVFYLDEEGLQTDVLFARYIVKDIVISVAVSNNVRIEADLVARDTGIDLAVIRIRTRSRPGSAFRGPVGYTSDLGWGDWVFIFGYPKGVKQLTGGWVSKGPYRSTLAVDAVVRFGYSGGAVFAVAESEQKLMLVGLIKSVPRSAFTYVGPDGTLPEGYPLSSADLSKLAVKSEMLVDYGTAYFVHPKAMRRFFQRKRPQLEEAGIHLDRKYYAR